MVDILPTNLDEIIALRLELTQQERHVIREASEAIDAKIKSTISHIGLRPKETDAELTAMMNKMEHTHATTIQTNVLERAFMYDMKKCQEKKKYLVEYNAIQVVLDELKSRRAALSKELKEKDATLDELYLGSRKLKLAEKIGCIASEITETRFSVPAEKLSQIIGKSGATLQKIQDECKVAIDTKETKTSNIRITGTEASIALAITAVLTIVSAITEEFPLADEKLVCLFLDKAAYAHEIEARNGVRIDISRAKKVCKVSGQPDGVRKAVAEIHAINAVRIKIPIEITILPFIVGKGGATIKALSEGNRVQIDIEREEKHIIVHGFRDESTRAATALLDIITENTEIEEIIKADKSAMIGCVIGSGGSTVRALQKEFGVQMQSQKGEKGELENLVIRGVTSKVASAKSRVLELLSIYAATTDEVRISDDLMALVVGKKGATISKLREKFPDAVIDIEISTVKIQSASSSTRDAIREALDEIVKANYTTSVPLQSDIGIAMKGARGVDVRALLSSLNLQFDIIPESESVKLRGFEDNVIQGIKAIDDFRAANHSIEMSCHEDDFSTVLSQGNADTSLKFLETGFNVEIRPNRKEGTIRIRGEKSAIDKVKAAIEGLLAGDPSMGSIVFPVQSQAFAAIIGKGGATMKKFEIDLDVKIDLLKTRGAIRVRGSASGIEVAKLQLLRFVDGINLNTSVDIDAFSKESVPEKTFQKLMELTSSIYSVEVGIEKSAVYFRGNMYLVEEAKQHLKEAIAGTSSFSQPIPAHLVQSVRSLEKDLLAVGTKNGVQVAITSDSAATGECQVSMSGSTESVTAAKVAVVKFLKHHLRSEYASVELPATCIKDMGAAFVFEVSMTGGCVLTVDRPMKCVTIIGEESSVAHAVGLLDAKMSEWKDHHATIPVEDYMLPVIIGKNGTAILALQKDLHVKIHLNRTAMLLELESAPTQKPEVLRDALRDLDEIVNGLKQHSWTTVIDTSLIGLFVGKAGVRINKIRTDSGALIEINKQTGAIDLRGSECCVASGKEMVMNIISEFPKSSTIQVHVPLKAFPFIIGAKGVKAQEITEVSGARFDLDRSSETAALKGSPEACMKLKELIEEILEKEGFNLKEVVEIVQKVKEVEAVQPVQSAYKLVGASESMAAAATAARLAAEANMSKSAIRRRRRREQDKLDELNGTKAEPVKDMSVPEAQEEEEEQEDELDGEALSEENETITPCTVTPMESEVDQPQLHPPHTSLPIPAPASSVIEQNGQKLFSSLLSVHTDFAGNNNGNNVKLPPGIDIVTNSPLSHGVIGRSPHGSPVGKSPSLTSAHSVKVISPPISRTASAENGEYNYFTSQNNYYNSQIGQPSMDSNLVSISETSLSPSISSDIRQVTLKASISSVSQSTDTFSAAPVSAPHTRPSQTTQTHTPAPSAPAPTQTSSLGLLDMLLGHTSKQPVTTAATPSTISASASHSNEMKAEQIQVLRNKQSQEKGDLDLSMASINNFLSAGSKVTPPSASNLRPSSDHKSGYYKSKSGFSVRL